jgi:hypothetical protein
VLTHLENGLSAVEYEVDGSWKKAEMNSDNGQVYILGQNSKNRYRIRLYDSAQQLIHQGRIYQFDFPKSCGEKCSAVHTEVSYQTLAPDARPF